MGRTQPRTLQMIKFRLLDSVVPGADVNLDSTLYG